MRHFCFLLFFVGSLLVFRQPLRALIDFALTRDYGSHIVLVVPASVCIFYLKRRELFRETQVNLANGLILFLLASGLWWMDRRYTAELFADERLSVAILAMVLLWISGFIFFYGTRAYARSLFPLLFLLLLIPMPDAFVAKVTYVLQVGSTSVAYGLLRLLHVPVFKHGFTLELPNLEVEVAEQCSGIRSSLGLLITTLLAGEFVMRSFWRKSLLTLSMVPVLVLKNGVRIVTISLLSVYVDRRFLDGWLHTSGGVVFYFLGIVAMVPIAILLRRGEGMRSKSPLPMPADSRESHAAAGDVACPAQTLQGFGGRPVTD